MKEMTIKEWLCRTVNFHDEILLHQKRLNSYENHIAAFIEISEELCPPGLHEIAAQTKSFIEHLYKQRFEVETAILSVKCQNLRTLLTRRYLNGETIKMLQNSLSKSQVLRLLKTGEREVEEYLKNKNGQHLTLTDTK